MNKKIIATISICASTLAGCQIDDEMHTIYDVYYETAFTTDSTNAVLNCAAKADILNQRWDVWITVEGGFETVNSDIVEYGHCWIKGDGLPTINEEGTNRIARNNNPTDNESFYSTITGLECETQYSVRSYVKTVDGHIAYNPEVLVVTTDHPHDKWFETQGFLNSSIMANRSDCVNITTTINGDTLTFFGMGRSGAVIYNDMWCYSSKKKTYEQIPPIKSNTGEIMSLWGSVGFVINYAENNVAHHLLYVGCGCNKPSGDIKITDYNQKFFVYDIDTRQWAEVSYLGENNDILIREPFTGLPRTGGIGFAIREWGFVGLGEFQNGSTKAYHSDIYLFMMSRDERRQYTPTSGYFKQMTDYFGYGTRSGASVVVVGDDAYIIGGIGTEKKDGEPEKTVYYDDFIPCHFTMPINSRPDSYTFTWPELNDRIRINEKLDNDPNDAKPVFPPRAFASAFSVNGTVFYGMGEGVDANGNKEYYSDLVKFDLKVNNLPKICAPYQNADSPASRASRAIVINGGDRAFVVGGQQETDGIINYNSSEWVYRP